MGVERESEL